jgi:hypothetical protein
MDHGQRREKLGGRHRRQPHAGARRLHAWSPDKVGRDVGELAGIEPLGVAATNDVAALLALKPDVVVYNPMWIDVDELVRILSARGAMRERHRRDHRVGTGGGRQSARVADVDARCVVKLAPRVGYRGPGIGAHSAATHLVGREQLVATGAERNAPHRGDRSSPDYRRLILNPRRRLRADDTTFAPIARQFERSELHRDYHDDGAVRLLGQTAEIGCANTGYFGQPRIAHPGRRR